VARPGHENEILALAALDASVVQLERHLGPSMERWRWGDIHHAWFTHPLAVDDATRELFNRGPVSRDGYGNTVNSTGGGAVDQTSGASFRAIFDLADWDRSVATSVPGQSGQPGSPHFDDLLPYWAEGRYFPLAFSRHKVEEVAEARLLLEPGGER
jgi:penicillin amidase